MSEIDELEDKVLNLAVSKALDYQCWRLNDTDACYQMIAPDNSRRWEEWNRAAERNHVLLSHDQWDDVEHAPCIYDLPQWSSNVAQAFELPDGEGWRWNTHGGLSELEVGVWWIAWGSLYSYESKVSWVDFPTRAHAYATACCRAWLKAKAAMG